jgi:hypothetical protein
MTTGKASGKNPKEKEYEILKKMNFIREGIKKAKKKKKPTS